MCLFSATWTQPYNNNNPQQSKTFTNCTVLTSPPGTVNRSSGRMLRAFRWKRDCATWKTWRLSKRFKKINWLDSWRKEGLVEKKTDCLMDTLSDSGPLRSFCITSLWEHLRQVWICPFFLPPSFNFSLDIPSKMWECWRMVHQNWPLPLPGCPIGLRNPLPFSLSGTQTRFTEQEKLEKN